MPIKSLEAFLFERNLVGSCPVDNIKNCRLGIDVDYYISRLLTSKRIAFADAIGDCPTTLKLFLDNDLKIFEESGITPVFVFNGFETSNQMEYSLKKTSIPPKTGLGLRSRNPYIQDRDSLAGTNLPEPYMPNTATLLTMTGDFITEKTAIGMTSAGQGNVEQILDYQRTNAWGRWIEQLKENSATSVDQPVVPDEPFRYGDFPIEIKKFKSELIQLFIEQNVQYMVAPFVSFVQLSYLLEEDYIDAIYGPTDLLLLEKVDKFITGLEFPYKEVRYIERSRILNEFNLSFNDFVDISMCCGNSLQPETLTPLNTVPEQQTFSYALDLFTNQGMDFYFNLKNLGASDALKVFERGLACLTSVPVLFSNGKVELYSTQLKTDLNTIKVQDPITNEQVVKYKFPKDVHDFIFKRLPHEYYFYHSVGLFSNTKLLSSIITNEYIETLPLGSKNIPQYHELVRKSVDNFKSKQFNLLTTSMNRYYQSRPIKHIKWFEPQDSEDIANKMYPTMFEKISSIVVKTGEDKPFTLSDFFSLFKNNKDWKTKFFTSSVIFPDSVPISDKLNTSFDLLSTALLRFLFLNDFFEFKLDSTTKKPKRLRLTSWGDILMSISASDKNENLESLLLLLIFLKQNVIKIDEVLNSTKYPSSVSDVTARDYPEETKYIAILSRLLLLCKFENKPIPYNGPIDYALLCFRDFYQCTSTNCRELFESCTVTSLVHGEFNRIALNSNSEWSQKIVKHMLFKTQVPNTLFAMIWQFYLQKSLHNNNDISNSTDFVNSLFNIPEFSESGEVETAVLEQGLKFLNSVSGMFKEMVKKNLINEKQSLLLDKSVAWATERVKSN